MDIQTQIGTSNSNGWGHLHEGCQDYCGNNGYEYASIKPTDSAEQCRCYVNCKPLNVGPSYSQFRVWQQVSYADTTGFRLSTSSASSSVDGFSSASSSDDGEAGDFDGAATGEVKCYDADGAPCLPSEKKQSRRLMFGRDACVCL